MSLKNILNRYFKPFNINGSIGARRLSEASLAAVEIRKVLKITFPGVKFSVTSETYAGGDSVNIGWTNGPTEDEVKKYTKDFQAGHFDSQADIYEYSNTNNLPQVKWIFWNRRISEKLQKFLDVEVRAILPQANLDDYDYEIEVARYKRKLLKDHSFPANID